METVFPEARLNLIVPQSGLHRLAADVLWQSREVKLLLKFGRKPWQNPATEATLTFQTLPQLLVRVE